MYQICSGKGLVVRDRSGSLRYWLLEAIHCIFSDKSVLLKTDNQILKHCR